MRKSFSSLTFQLVRTLPVVLLLCLLPASLFAQIAGSGSIQGSVTDSTGAVVPGATVVLVENSTQTKRTATTDSGGVYSFPNITVSTYTLTVSMAGFKTFQQNNIVLEVGSSIAINAGLQVGSTDQKIEVTTDQLALQTEDVAFKQTIDQKAVTEMPLNGRQMTGLIALSGGSAPAPGGDFTGSKYSYQTVSVSIAGGNGNSTEWLLDGGNNNDFMGGGNLPFPFPDAVSQFSVESTALGAQSGTHSGGQVNVVTRSGTNTYHGSGFEFIRNNYLDATNFFAAGKDTLHQNQYGGTFGGPVRIPKLYNGKDRLFFFVGYQFEKAVQSTATTTQYIPTAANLAGDWSTTDPAPLASGGTGVANNCGSVQQLYDPITGVALPGNKYGQPGGPALPTYNAQALALYKYLPKIDPSVDVSNCGLVKFAIPYQLFDKQFVTREDYTINAKNHLYGRYLLDGYQFPSFFSPTNILITQNAPGNYERVQSGTIGEDYALSSTTVNSAHITINRRVDVRSSAPGINACDIGITQYCAVATGLQLAVGSSSVKNHYWNTYCGTCAPGHYNDNTLTIDDDVNLVRGKHQIVFGGEYVRNQLNIVGAYESNGNFTDSGIYSGNGPTGLLPGATKAATAGDANLDFLMGSMSAYQQSKQQQNALRGNVPSLYAQDTWHADKKLTMVAGLRWSPTYMPVDVFNRGSIFNMAAFLANQVSSVYPTAPAGSFFYGDPGVTREFTQNSPWQFSPNVGLSYDPGGNGKTVIRAGAEFVYDQPNYFTAQRVNQNPPFATASSPNTSQQLCFSTPWLIGGTGYGCSQVGGTNTSPFPQPVVPTKAQAVFPAQGQFIVLPKHFLPSDTFQWTASIQHEFSHGWELQLDYIGNKTSHSPIGTPFNPAVYIPGNWGAGGTGCAGIVTTGPAAVTPGAAGTPCSTTANQKSRFALAIANPLQGNQYLGGGGGSVVINDFGTANYNGLVTTVQHRLSSTFSLLANWTWSKCLNEADGMGDLAGTSIENPANPALDYGPCGSDYRHIENVVIVAKSEFGLSNRLVKLLVNNWELAPLVHIQSGAPFTVTQGSDISLTDVGNDRPNLVPGVPIYLHQNIEKVASEATHGYLNQAAFAPNLIPGTYGNIGRNSFRGIPSYQVDAQISRIFVIHGLVNLDFRLEAFNALNHPNFSNPSASTGAGPAVSGTFGQISATTNEPGPGASSARVFQGGFKVSF
ncbi:carboxypeptidase-like regulatory domain-containing protein [Granulicella paludicola]|uniref:carboxypeptidase-like regulatory domain-containing protein n=1 Tax=Granulicella paludicola TaxID=474951 RepID=UPI0021DF444C|nr:carboxypeptidase-like regulatory domain-containing protein [Granulicella paludicola]